MVEGVVATGVTLLAEAHQPTLCHLILDHSVGVGVNSVGKGVCHFALYSMSSGLSDL